MRTAIATFVAASTVVFSASTPAAEIFKDYVPSKEVYNVTFVKVAPNRFDDYLGGLRQTWWSSCEIGKKMGTVSDCAIYASETTSNRDFNLILVVKTPSAALSDPDEARYNAFTAEWRKQLAEDKLDQLVEGYSEMRSFFGEQDFRRITFK